MGATLRQIARRGAGIGTLALVAVMLSACLQVSSVSVIKPDLTGTTIVRVGFSKAVLNEIQKQLMASGGSGGGMTMLSPKDLMMSSGDNAQIIKLGGTVKDFEDANVIGQEVTFTFKTLDEMQTQINTTLGSSTSMGMGTGAMMPAMMPGSPGADALLQIAASKTATGIRVEGAVDPLSTLTMMGMGGMMGGGAMSADLAKLIRDDPNSGVTLSFQMPGTIRIADAGATRDGTTVTWVFALGDPVSKIFVESDLTGA